MRRIGSGCQGAENGGQQVRGIQNLKSKIAPVLGPFSKDWKPIAEC